MVTTTCFSFSIFVQFVTTVVHEAFGTFFFGWMISTIKMKVMTRRFN